MHVSKLDVVPGGLRAPARHPALGGVQLDHVHGKVRQQAS
jgi:hypothetical protein